MEYYDRIEQTLADAQATLEAIRTALREGDRKKVFDEFAYLQALGSRGGDEARSDMK